MKTLTLAVLVALFSTQTFASTLLLSCNPPMGSSLQEVKITQDGNKIYRAELNMSGSMSAPVEIKAATWVKQDLKWTSRNEGNVHLYKVKGQSYWSYASTNIGSSVMGYCEE